MIDTVWLTTEPECYFVSSPGLLDVEMKVKAGAEIVSETMYKNLPHFSVDIGNDKRLRLKTSLPKTLLGTSLYEIGEEHFERAVDFVEGNLKKVGISVPKNRLEDFWLSRIDYCRNISVEHPIPDYLNLLSKFKMPRKETTEYKFEHIRWGSGSSVEQFSAYDKVGEVLSSKDAKNLDIKNLAMSRPRNLLRLETRTRKPQTIGRLLKTMHPTLEKAFTFKHCTNKVSFELNKLVRDSNNQLDFAFEENLKLLDACMAMGERSGFSRFLQVKATSQFLEDFRYDWGAVRTFLELRYKRSQVFALLKTLKRNMSLSFKPEERDLLGELKQKVYLRVA